MLHIVYGDVLADSAHQDRLADARRRHARERKRRWPPARGPRPLASIRRRAGIRLAMLIPFDRCRPGRERVLTVPAIAPSSGKSPAAR